MEEVVAGEEGVAAGEVVEEVAQLPGAAVAAGPPQAAAPEGAGGERGEEAGSSVPPRAVVPGEVAPAQPRMPAPANGELRRPAPVGGRVDLTPFTNPTVPGPSPGAPAPDIEGWGEIDRLGAWGCAVCFTVTL